MPFKIFVTACALMLCLQGTSQAEVLLTDDFESGAFSPDWDSTLNATLVHDPGNGAGGSDYYAHNFIGGDAQFIGGMGVSLSNSYAEEEGNYFYASAFSITFDFRIVEPDPTNRAFSFKVSGHTPDPHEAFPAFELNYDLDEGGWNVHNRYHGYNPDHPSNPYSEKYPISLDDIAPNQWHTMTIQGHNWWERPYSNPNPREPLPEATVSVYLTDYLGNTSEALDLIFWHSISHPNGGARSLHFSSNNDYNPGYDVDNVTISADFVFVPEPASIAAVGIGGLVLIRRR